MTTNTFVADKAGETKDTLNTGNPADQAGGNVSDLQTQINVMQKRLGDKDTHISTIETENQQLREMVADVQSKIDRMTTIEEALSKLNSNQGESNQDTALDEKELVNKVLNELKVKTEEEKAEANFKQVSSTLSKTFGEDKVDSKVKQVAEANGLSFDDIISLSKRSPQAVYNLMGLGTQTGSMAPAKGSMSSNSLNEGQTREAKLAEFAKLRRENPTQYWKPEVQREFRKLFTQN